MKKENQNNKKTGTIQHDWNHRCLNLGCNNIWDSDDLCEPCPKCASGEHETICHIPELADWNCTYPGEWKEALELQEKIKLGKCREIEDRKLEILYADMLDECYPCQGAGKTSH